MLALIALTSARSYDKEGWYSRVENNNWRSIAFNMLPRPADLDMECSKPPERGREWHYSRLQRWQDREKKQRRRRIEWMQKLYRQARLDNAAAADVASPYNQPAAPPGTGAPFSKLQLSDHNLPMRTTGAAAADDLQPVEWLMRAKSLKAGALWPARAPCAGTFTFLKTRCMQLTVA